MPLIEEITETDAEQVKATTTVVTAPPPRNTSLEEEGSTQQETEEKKVLIEIIDNKSKNRAVVKTA